MGFFIHVEHKCHTSTTQRNHRRSFIVSLIHVICEVFLLIIKLDYLALIIGKLIVFLAWCSSLDEFTTNQIAYYGRVKLTHVNWVIENLCYHPCSSTCHVCTWKYWICFPIKFMSSGLLSSWISFINDVVLEERSIVSNFNTCRKSCYFLIVDCLFEWFRGTMTIVVNCFC